MTVFDEAIDAIFADPNFVLAAQYTAPGGGSPVSCSIVLDKRDIGSRPDDGRPVAGQVTIEVRKSELAAPAKGGQFTPGTIQAGVFVSGPTTYTVMNRPAVEDEDGLIWKMWAT
jgi:hypothetical protein